MPGSPHEARTQRQWAPPSPVAYSAYGLDPAAPSLELKRTQAALGAAHSSSADGSKVNSRSGGAKLGRAPQLRPPSAERHTLVPLATQPSLAEVKQTDCGDAGAASAYQVRAPSPTAQPVDALTKSTECRSWAPRQTRTQVRPPSRVLRMVPLPTAKPIWVPTAWTASNASTRPNGSVVVGPGGWGAGLGWFCPGPTATVVGGAGAAPPRSGGADWWAVERAK